MLALIMPKGFEIAQCIKKISRGQVVTLGLNHPVYLNKWHCLPNLSPLVTNPQWFAPYVIEGWMLLTGASSQINCLLHIGGKFPHL